MQILLAMNGAPGPATSLMSFLLTQTSNPMNLCVTGHSLGGCLAGTFALYLKDNPSMWDASGKSNVSCITFAGPTAGNDAFASYSDTRFNGAPNPPNWDSTLGTTCDAVRCSLDVAPMAWISSNLSASSSSSPLFSIYVPNLDFIKHVLYVGALPGRWCCRTFCLIWRTMLSSQDYTQIVASAASVQGTFNTAYTPTADTLIPYLQAFIAQAAYQHSFSYPIVLQVPVLNSTNIIVRGATPGTTTGVRMVPRLARPLMIREGSLAVS